MECARVRHILSEYIDGVLDYQTAGLLEGHLEECEKCHKEYISLNRLVNEIGLMAPVEAPKDFLQKINERIDAQPRFGGALRFLLFPARIKIPLELTALAMTAALIFLIFNTIQPDKKFIDTPLNSDETRIASVSVPESQEETDSSFSGGNLEKRRSPIMLTLVLEPKQRDKVLSSENVLFATRDLDTTANMPELSFRAPLSKQDETELVDIISGINEIIILTEGSILSKGNEDATGNTEYINVEIPAANYQSFLGKIEKVASLQEPAPKLPDGYRDKVLLNIKIKASN